MLRTLIKALFLLPLCVVTARAQPAVPAPEVESERGVKVVVIPVREQIAAPVLYVVRRGLKEAIERKVDAVVLDMKTPGGDAGSMLEIMEALEKFPGRTLTYVNDEAGSAGALIAAVTDAIYFAPTGVMGAAELITGTGADVPEALKRKMTSFLAAKVRAFSDSDPQRADVLKAMMNAEFELKLGDTVLKSKGELLTLTAKEAVKAYGDPPRPLLAAGIATDLDDVLVQEFGDRKYSVEVLQITWSEKVAQYLNAISPILLGLGLLALFIEFKTPGFGIFGIGGIVLLSIVFLGHYVAGFSGHEPILLFALGLVLVVVEILFLPGILVMALTGLVLMIGSLLWAMADLWPNEPVQFSGGTFMTPLMNLGFGMAIAVALGAALLRFMPRGWLWDRMVLNTAIATTAQESGAAPREASVMDALVGRRGVAVTDLFPSGQIEIDGGRYEARLAVGSARAGAAVTVVGRSGFAVVVEVLPS